MTGNKTELSGVGTRGPPEFKHGDLTPSLAT